MSVNKSCAIPAATYRDSGPASQAQRRFWLLDKLSSHKHACNVCQTWDIEGPLDLEILRRTLAEFWARHDILRTGLVFKDGALVQEIRAQADPPFILGDLSDATDAFQEALRLAQQALTEPFDVSRPPLWRNYVWRIGPERHLMVITKHHAAADGWSNSIFAKELSILYEAFLHCRTPKLPVPTMSYLDFALREAEELRSPSLIQRLEECSEEIHDLPPLELPTDFRNPANEDDRAGLYTFTIDSPLNAQIRRFANECGATRFEVFLAVYIGFLFRQTGKNEFGVGTLTSNRLKSEVRSIVGPFINTLVLPCRVQSQSTFRLLLKEAKAIKTRALRSQGVPFDLLVKQLGTQQGRGRTPLIDAMLVYQNTPPQTPVLPGCTVRSLQLRSGIAHSELLLEVYPEDVDSQMYLTYRAASFGRVTIARMVDRFTHLLKHALQEPDRGIGDLEFLPPEERATILGKWITPGDEGNRSELPVDSLFSRQAAQNTDAAAVIKESRVVTYGQLDRWSQSLGAVLAHAGVKAGEIVGVLLPHSIEFIASIIGILKARGIYLPLEVRDPRERIAGLLNDATVTKVISTDDYRDILPEDILVIPPLATDQDPSASPECRTAEDPAYVMYTSGSTGAPKGVVVPHRGIDRLACTPRWMDIRREDVFLFHSATNFDASTLEIWGALLNGAKVVVAGAGVTSAYDIARLIAQHHITVMLLTTSVFNAFVEEDASCLSGLRVLFVCGEVINKTKVAKALDRLRGCTIFNGYGPTENTTFTTVHAVNDVTDDRPIPIGRPIDRTYTYILDEKMCLVPAGVVGELFTGGDGLACGYLGKPELTAERFVNLPASSLGIHDGRKTIRLYRTGDLTRWRADGAIEFLGRADRQIKLRGFRIEPAEVESALMRCSGVKQAVVKLWQNNQRSKLVAYVVAHHGKEPKEEALLTELKHLLPAWMVPARVLFINKLPLTPSGKTDLRVLVDPLEQPFPSEEQPPSTDLQAKLVKIMSSILGIDKIGLHDDFFGRGGDSLAAIQLLGRIESTLDTRLVAEDFLKQPTVAHTAKLIEQGLSRPVPPELELICRSSGSDAFFFAHDVFGCPFGGRIFAPHLPESISVYGLRPVDDDRGETFESLARCHVRAIRSVQPAGPYHISGFSYGAHLAYEIACQFAAANETVGIVAIIDSIPGFDAIEGVKGWPGGAAPRTEKHFAHRSYRLYPGRVLYFQSSEHLDRTYLLPGGGWEHLALEGVCAVRIPGSHVAAVREPASRLIGETLRRVFGGERIDQLGGNGVSATFYPWTGIESAWRLRARDLAQAGDLEAQFELYFHELSKGASQPAWIFVNFADICLRLERFKVLEDLIHNLKPVSHSDPRLAFALGRICQKLSRWEAAAEYFQTASRLETREVVPQIALAWAIDSEAGFRRAVSMASHDVMVRCHLVDYLDHAGRFTEAIHELQAALELDPAEETLHRRLNKLKSRVQ